ncbi:MAG TPA: hypothetical protein DDW50_22855 [Firmicutes bacterium]|jgi:YYY domain-containing protein|nr:hypothetical protein [Bacillota bacterium]
MRFTSFFLWWFYIFLIGFIFLPLTVKIFSRFYDKGYLFAKTIGIAITAYLVWLFSSLRLIPFLRISIFGILLFTLGIIFFLGRGLATFKSLRTSKIFVRSLIGEEFLFLAALIGWSFIRSLRPEIYGLEKFMDFGFVNSILRTRYMPPADIWFAGSSINYYYFGHYICAFLTKLSGIDSAVTYNLMIATLFAFCLALSFSITSNLIYVCDQKQWWKALSGGSISALLLSFGSNLHPFIYGFGLPWLKNHGLYHSSFKNYYYPDSTRFIGYNPPTHDKTIHEFPSYSFIVADLHAHVSNIPYVLTILAVLMALIFRVAVKPDHLQSADKIVQSTPDIVPTISHNKTISGLLLSCRQFFINEGITIELILVSFLLAIFQMTNYWDFPIYLVVTIGILVYANLMHFDCKAPFGKVTIHQILWVVCLSKVLTVPFQINNTTQGIRLTLAHSSFYQLLVLWGYQLVFGIAFLLVLYFEYRLDSKNYPKPFKKFQINWKRWIGYLRTGDVFCMILLLAALGLVMIPELVYVKDIYSGDYKRSNTMFKLTFQAFIMFSLAIGYIYFRITGNQKTAFRRLILRLLLLVFIGLPLIYPYYSIALGYYGVPKISRSIGLDGMQFLKQLHPDDYQAILWLNHYVKDQPAILEANGDSYTDYERISMATGLPTIQGWYVHEWLWRGNPDVVNQRVQEVNTVYESDNLKATWEVLRKYNIQYIIIGDLERSKFINLKTSKLMSLGKVVFQSATTSIIKVIKI